MSDFEKAVAASQDSKLSAGERWKARARAVDLFDMMLDTGGAEALSRLATVFAKMKAGGG